MPSTLSQSDMSRYGITITHDEWSYELAIDGLELWVGTKAECEAKAIELTPILTKSFTENKG